MEFKFKDRKGTEYDVTLIASLSNGSKSPDEIYDASKAVIYWFSDLVSVARDAYYDHGFNQLGDWSSDVEKFMSNAK